MRLSGLSLVLLAAAFFAAPAVAVELPAPLKGLDPARTTTLSAAGAVARDCDAAVATGRGVASTTWTAPGNGVLTARLTGKNGDWDLAAFDTRGRRLAASQAFFANEVVQVGLRAGQRVTLQACRRSGSSASVPLSTQFAHIDVAAAKSVLGGKPQLVHVVVPNARAFERLHDSGLDVTHNEGPGFAKVVAYGAADLNVLRSLGLPFRVEVADMLAQDRENRRLDRLYQQRVAFSALPTGRTAYRVYEDYQAELKKLVEDFPELVQPITLSHKSFQGRDIQAIEIARDVKNGDDGRPVFTLGAVHHAREWPASESVMEFAWDLVKNHGTDANLARILDEVRVVIMPITNPDGFIFSRTSSQEDPTLGNIVFGGYWDYKRKNCNNLVVPNGAVPCEAAIGVDNNRNYAQDWGGPGASSNPHDPTYRGSAPFSEPENLAVRELTLTTNSPVHVSAHNIAAKVLRPPGLEVDGFAPDEEALKALGKLMADPTGYVNEYGWQLYDTTGSSKDWGYGATGQYGYTIELGPPGRNDFHGPYSSHVVGEYQGRKVAGKQLGGVREAYIRAALYTRNEAQTSRLTGAAPAGATLRITKDFVTETSPVCTIADPHPLNVSTPLDYCTAPLEVIEVPEHIDLKMQVGESGQFTWWLNPSTRPFELKAGRSESYTLTCTVGGQMVKTQSVTVARGQTLAVDACGA